MRFGEGTEIFLVGISFEDSGVYLHGFVSQSEVVLFLKLFDLAFLYVCFFKWTCWSCFRLVEEAVRADWMFVDLLSRCICV